MKDSRFLQTAVVNTGPRGNAHVPASSAVSCTDSDRGPMTQPHTSGGMTRLSPITSASGPSSLRCKVPAASTRWAPPTNGKHNSFTAAAPGTGTRTLLPNVGEQHPVVAFLRSHGLGSYAELFMQNGFDDLDTLLDIGEADIRALGIPHFHATTLMDATRNASGRVGAQSLVHGVVFDERNPVAIFLKDVGLAQYAEPLLRSGFDEMEILFDIEDEDMKDLGIPRGHALKLRKRMQQYRDDGGAGCCQPLSGQPISQGPPLAAMRQAASYSSKPSPSMFLPPTEIMKTAVERSWEQVQGVGNEVVAERLYRNFFAIVPEAIQLFPPEVLQKYQDWRAEEGSCADAMECAAMRKLWAKVVNVVGCSVAGLHDINRLVPMLRQLGMRHINYGPTEEYWDRAGKALNITLRQYLGEDFTPEVEQAWTMTYSFITAVMISGLREAKEAAQKAGLAMAAAQSQETHDDTWQKLSSLQVKTPDAGVSHAELATHHVAEPLEELHSKQTMPRPLPLEPNRWGNADAAEEQS